MSEKEENKYDQNFKILADRLNVNIPTHPYKSSSEYAAAVNAWLWQCYNWQCMVSTFPYFMSQTVNRTRTDNSIDLNRNFSNTYFPNQNLFIHQNQHTNVPYNVTSLSPNQIRGTDYLIPPLRKRFAAEVIDFCILLLLKILITYIAVDYFNIVDLEKFDFDFTSNEKLDYHKAVEVTSEIIAMEVAHRFLVCIFEAICIYKGVGNNGGATPGKTIMGLRVVSCRSIVTIEGQRVRVYPAGDLGLGWALVRAFIKNFSLAFIFPVFFTMYFFQHNRTAYDIICNSIVVEELAEQRQENEELFGIFH